MLYYLLSSILYYLLYDIMSYIMLCNVFFGSLIVKDDSYVMLYECHYPSDNW